MDLSVGDYVELTSEWLGAIWQVTKISDPPSFTLSGLQSSIFQDQVPTVQVKLICPPSGWSWRETPAIKSVWKVTVKAINEVEVFIRMANWIPKPAVSCKPVHVPKKIAPLMDLMSATGEFGVLSTEVSRDPPAVQARHQVQEGRLHLAML